MWFELHNSFSTTRRPGKWLKLIIYHRTSRFSLPIKTTQRHEKGSHLSRGIFNDSSDPPVSPSMNSFPPRRHKSRRVSLSPGQRSPCNLCPVATRQTRHSDIRCRISPRRICRCFPVLWTLVARLSSSRSPVFRGTPVSLLIIPPPIPLLPLGRSLPVRSFSSGLSFRPPTQPPCFLLLSWKIDEKRARLIRARVRNWSLVR